MEGIESKVYVRMDDRIRIIRCEGGYTTPDDLSGWIEIDEGVGDRYNLAQSNYFPGGLYTLDGIPKYKLVDGYENLPLGQRTIERLESDIQKDRDALPKPEKVPTIKELEARLAAAIESNKMLEECLVEMAGKVYA